MLYYVRFEITVNKPKLQANSLTKQVKFNWANGSPFIKQVARIGLLSLKARYRNTIAGFIWVACSPIIRFLTHLFIFSHVLKLPVRGYPLFLLSGLMPWFFATQSIQTCSTQLVTQGSLLRNTQNHPLVFLLPEIMINVITLFVTFYTAAAVIAISTPISWAAVTLFPLACIPLAIAVTGTSWLVATSQVFFRDTAFILPFSIQIGFLITPIFYSIEMVPEHLRGWFLLNPLFYLLRPFQLLVNNPNLSEFFVLWSQAMAIGVALLCAAYGVWMHCRTRVAFHV